MKCKNCQYCSQRGGYQYFHCDRNNSIINADDYYRGAEANCVMSRLDEDDFTDNYMMWMIARK